MRGRTRGGRTGGKDAIVTGEGFNSRFKFRAETIRANGSISDRAKTVGEPVAVTGDCRLPCSPDSLG